MKNETMKILDVSFTTLDGILHGHFCILTMKQSYQITLLLSNDTATEMDSICTRTLGYFIGSPLYCGDGFVKDILHTSIDIVKGMRGLSNVVDL
mmetsp:Transcript_28476/g.51918  ORF Transcript_28476/g.51918 Transcript_28476/m.51918 type:complete len:94 (+) Transcript_28476:2592-2873(+)